ncbi:hypothetical protein [Niveispirillum fermenti]|uniref:hypothetical protein n=1 Tax=Niveispirillum fermenti TaxID=1233113 RepID=UPI003A864D60
MTLLYLIAGSAASILFITALHHWLGRSDSPRLPDTATAMRQFADLMPDEKATGATLSADGGSALLDLDMRDRLGLLLPMGQFWVARRLHPADIAGWAIRDSVLTLRLADFTTPAFRLAFADAATAAQWRQRLDSFKP